MLHGGREGLLKWKKVPAPDPSARELSYVNLEREEKRALL
jgi:hypothetical protein